MFWIIFYVASLMSPMDIIQGECPKIVTREEWGSAYPLSRETLKTPVSKVFFLHSNSPECTTTDVCKRFMRNTQVFSAEELNRGDISSNFMIAGDGNIYEGRGWKTVGAHTYRHNQDSIGISFVGSYGRKDPKEQMLRLAEQLIEYGVNQTYISPDYGVYGHRDGTCSMGPGRHFYNTLKAKWPHWHAQGELENHCALTEHY